MSTITRFISGAAFTTILLLGSALPAQAAALTTAQAESLIAVVQSSPSTPASAFVNLITEFSNITVAQATSLIAVVQASPGASASVFVPLITSFTVGTTPVTIDTNTPSITVLSPNGSNVWRVGDTQQIIWKSQGVTATNYNVQIGIIDTRYSTEAGPRGEAIIANSIPNSGSYSWTIPHNVGTMDLTDTSQAVYKIVIHSWSDSVTGVALSDSSDDAFSVVAGAGCENGAIYNQITNQECPVAGAPVITVTSPRGNVWSTGTNQTITWTDSAYASGRAYSVIVTNKFGDSYGVIASPVTGTSVQWNVGTFADGSKLGSLMPGESSYYIRVGINGETQRAWSNTSPFTLSATPPAASSPLLVLVPSVNETWHAGAGERHTIRWQGGDPTWHLAVILNDRVNARATVIASGAPNNGSYEWEVPSGVPAGQYLITISCQNCPAGTPGWSDDSTGSVTIASSMTPPSTAAASCTLDGQTVVSGQYGGFYSSRSVTAPTTCSSVSRLCSNGTLGGNTSYIYSSCTVVAPPSAVTSCTLPWGGSIASGSIVAAFQSSTVTSPAVCYSQSRTCANGVLSGSYVNQNCSVVTASAASCALPWGGSIANGTSVAAFLSSSVTAPSGCSSQTRTCTNGALSGSYTSPGCNVVNPPAASCTLDGQTIVSGRYGGFYSSRTVTAPATCPSAARLCTNGSFGGDASYIYSSCSVVTPPPTSAASCTLDGQVLPSGQTATGYEWRATTLPATCASISGPRTCTNGYLSGNANYVYRTCKEYSQYDYDSSGSVDSYDSGFLMNVALRTSTCPSNRVCDVNRDGYINQADVTALNNIISPQVSCTFNGQTIANGSSVTAYSVSSANSPAICAAQSMQRLCSNGVLGGSSSYMYSTCTPTTAAPCTLDGQTVASGSYGGFYSARSVTSPASCPSQPRLCTNGTFGGDASYIYSSCNVVTPSGSVFGASTSFQYTWNTDLQIGSPYTNDIKALQQALTLEGVYSGEVTGGFYTQTFLAVKLFQQKYGIQATGYVGPMTREKLNALY